MRKLIVQQWVTADNIAAEQDGGLSFVSGEPFDEESPTPSLPERMMQFIDSVDTMILGANTYAQTKDYWPNATDQVEYGEKLNSLTKYVASPKFERRTLGSSFPRDRDPRPGGHHPHTQGRERQGPLAVGKPDLMLSLQDAGLSTRSGCWSARLRAARAPVSSRTGVT